MPSFSVALSGLQANSVAMNSIGNNLANLNTTAYKKQDANFSDMFYQSIGTNGSSAPLQIGAGTRVSAVNSDFSQGNIASTGLSTNMAINGNGFFVVDSGGTKLYSRSGDFQLAANGDLTTHDGNRIMGYPSVDGVVNTHAPLQDLNVPIGKTQSAHATTSFSFNTNLDASSSIGATYTSSSLMFDSQGSSHVTSVTFTKTSSNEWTYNVALPSGDASTTSGNTGSLHFNVDGTLALPTGDVTGITFGGLTDGAGDMTLKWSLRDGSGNSLVTQSAGASSTNAKGQDGYAAGAYKSFSVDGDGVMTALYTNGGSEVLGQIAIAEIPEPEALTRNGSNLYDANEASGTPDIGIANTGSRGSIAGSALEQSNVDISTEFADLIVAQRSFEANSKTVTAFDTITQDTINLIR